MLTKIQTRSIASYRRTALVEQPENTKNKRCHMPIERAKRLRTAGRGGHLRDKIDQIKQNHLQQLKQNPYSRRRHK